MSARTTKIKTSLITLLLIILQACGGGSSGGTGSAGGTYTPSNNNQSTNDANQNEQDNQAAFVNALAEANCEQEALPDITGEQNYIIRNITASYYREEDGVTELVDSEPVARIYNAYVRDDFLEIPGEDFLGIWEGEIEVFDEQATVYVSMNSHYSFSGFYLDDTLLKGGENCQTVIPLILPRGVHTFKAEYYSEYFSTGFIVNFTDQHPISSSDASEQLGTISTSNSKVFAVSGYEADTNDGVITVSLPESADDIILVLSTYDPVVWQIENTSGATLTAVLVTSTNKFSEVDVDSGTPVFYLDDLDYVSSDEAASELENIEQLTGFPVSYYNYEYNLVDLDIAPSNNSLDTEIIGRKVIVLNNYVLIAEDIQSAESHETDQQLATYFSLNKSTVLTSMEWTGSLTVNYPDSSSSNSSILRPHLFVIQIYSGTNLPGVLIDEITTDVFSEERYELDNKVVNRFTLEAEQLFDLPAGEYWISIQEERSENIGFYWILDGVIDDGDSGAGGSFRSSPNSLFWASTSSFHTARSAPAGNLLIRGIERY
ncbi:hypothetical protein SAMN02745866_03796 [Alteromonadaceae bacterium Bs31]|nr:hypothetical protein SAMN02745866_03796 [Alteromonadaceae bacterium Bs31]